MKVLFLDIDGVVNCSADFDPASDEYKRSKGYPLNSVLIELVKHIVQETGCLIVLSSSWRLSADGYKIVAEHFDLYDVTPNKRGLTDRGCEVIEWLSKRTDVTTYAILDDNSDFHKEQPLFLTGWATGITPEIARQVVEHLNG